MQNSHSHIPAFEARELILGIALTIATGLLPDLLGSKYWAHNFQLVNIVIAAAVFQNLLMHDANQVSFGQGAIFGTGTYICAMAVAFAGVAWPLAIAVAAVAAGGAGLLYALPALRVQGYYLGFVTLSAAMVFPELLFALDKYTNGINGVSVPAGAWRAPLVAGITPLTLATVAVACGAMVFHVHLRHSSFGRKIKIAGASPEAAQTLGIRPGLVRSAVFLIAAVGTGMAGALYVPIIGFVTPAAFHLEFSILLFLAVIVGGRGHILGPITGIYLLYLLPNVLLVDLVDYRLLAYGLLALVVMLAMPDGVIGTIRTRMGGSSTIVSADLNPDRFPLPRNAAVAAPTQSSAAPAEISIRNATKTFGAVVAMDKVDFDVTQGQIVGLIGGNGSGKTTLLNAVAGFNRLSAGSVHIRGEDVSIASPARIARLGIGRTFQTPRIFDTLSAWENILIGKECPLGRGGQSGASIELQDLERGLADATTETIPHGLRRSMEVLRVVLTGADVLLFDEPAAGLSSDERRTLSALLRRLKTECGKTIVLVEHDLNLVWRIADKIVVMDRGKVVASGAPRDLVHNPDVTKLFVRPLHA